MSADRPCSRVGRGSRVRRIVLCLLLVLAALALALYLGAGALAAHILSRPERNTSAVTPATADLPYRDVRFSARTDGVEVAAWHVPREGADRAVIMVHGMNVSRGAEFEGRWVEVARRLWEAESSVLMIDLRGHGASADARFSFGLRERRDVAGAVEWLLEEGYAPGAIGVLGVSMGGAAAIGAAAEIPAVGAVATDAAFADVEPIIRRAWPVVSGLPAFLWRPTRWMGRLMYGYDLGGSRPGDDLARLRDRPLLLIHGEADRLVPVENARLLAERHGDAAVRIVPGADHARSFFADPEAYGELVARFFGESLPVRRVTTQATQ
jgi:uncharacterized protein